MKKYISAFLLLLLAGNSWSQVPLLQKEKAVIAIHGDYNQENFQWSIAGNSSGQNPNVLSEVIWKNLKGPGVGLDVRLNVWSHIIFKGNFHQQFIRSGTATDTDYGSDNRTNQTYRANLSSHDGYTWNYAAALGYAFAFGERWEITPFAGYTQSKQSLHLQQAKDEPDDGGKKLNSTYQVDWKGALIGFDLGFKPVSRVLLATGFNYKQLNYSGTADWNLIDAFEHPVSFRHHAKGFETQAYLKLGYQITPLIGAFVRGDYFYAETGTGTDELFLVDGQRLKSQFNGAIRKGGAAGAGVSFSIR